MPFCIEVPLLILRGITPGVMEVERGSVLEGVEGRATGIPGVMLGRDALSRWRVLMGNLVLKICRVSLMRSCKIG